MLELRKHRPSLGSGCIASPLELDRNFEDSFQEISSAEILDQIEVGPPLGEPTDKDSPLGRHRQPGRVVNSYLGLAQITRLSGDWVKQPDRECPIPVPSADIVNATLGHLKGTRAYRIEHLVFRTSLKGPHEQRPTR